jgi:GH25 family lysozyme M1 (1,4-beta-N-acetylmuramidase)
MTRTIAAVRRTPSSLVEPLEHRVLFARVEGVDVSVFQGAINWNTLASHNKQFAFVRASRTNLDLDPNFKTNMANAKTAGVLTGAYHRALPQGEGEAGPYTDPVTDANRFYTAAGAYMTAGYLRPVLDIEDGSSLGKAALSSWVNSFTAEVERLSGVRPIIYCNTNFATNLLDTTVAANHDLWIARWNGGNSGNVNPQTDQPETPSGYANPYGSWNVPVGGAPSNSSWDFWQYTSNGDGVSLGVSSTRLDLDVFNGDLEQLRRGFLTGYQWNYPNGTPFAIVPGAVTTIQAEDYDNGGEGYAFHDTTPKTNTGGVYRTGPKDGVDIAPISGATGQFRLKDTVAGEWVEYTVNVAQAGNYKLEFRCSQTDPGATFHASLDGANVTGTLGVPDTNDLNVFANVAKTVSLPAGVHVLRVSFDTGGSNGVAGGFDSLRVSPATTSQTLTLGTSTAAYVRGGTFANSNFGSASELLVKQGASNDVLRETYIKFDLSSVATISSAKLRLFGRLNDTATPSLGLRVYNVAYTNWAENLLTYNNRPTAGLTQRATFNMSGTTSKTYDVDLTSFLQSEKAAGRNLVTLVLRGSAVTSSYATFSSDEMASGPKLILTT